MNDPEPVPTPSAGADRSGLVTRAGSQANRYSIELGAAIQALVRATECEPAIPASELLVVFGHLHTAGYGLAQALQQLGTCLRRSTEQGLYWASGEDVDPAAVAACHLAVAEAHGIVLVASRRAEQCGELVGRAQRQLVAEARAVEARLRRYYARTPDAEQIQPPVETSGRLSGAQRRRRWGLTAEERLELARADLAAAGRDWLTAEDAAELLGIAVSTIKTTWALKQIGPTRHRVHGWFAYSRTEVLAVRDQRRTGRPAA